MNLRNLDYRFMLNTHALMQVNRPIYIPNTNLAIYPHEIMYSLPQPVVFVPQDRREITREKYEKDINKVYEQVYGADIQKPPKMYWLGNPVG